MDDRMYALEGERQAGAPTITHPPSGSHVGTNVILWGTATPGSRIEILDGTKPLCSIEADDTGFWGASLRGMRRGTHDFRARELGEDEHIEYSEPLQVVVEAAPAEKRWWARPVLAVAGIAIATAVAVGAVALAGAHLSLPGSFASAKRIAPPTRSVPTRPAAPAPARSWSFPGLARQVDQTILTLNNPGGRPATVTIRLQGGSQRATLQAQGEAEMELGTQARSGRIRITSTMPIIAERIIITHGTTSTSYGSHS